MIYQSIQLRKENENITMSAYVRTPIDFSGPRPAIIICPGGGYGFTSPNESEPVALRFMTMGYHAFVLHYTVESNTPPEKLVWPEPLFDLASAVIYIKEHASEWNLDPEQLAVCGFSAGGHLAGMYACNWNKPVLSEHFSRPADDFRIRAAMLIYPVIDFCVGPSLVDWRMMWNCANPVEKFNRFMFGTADPSEEDLREKSPAYLADADTVPCFIAHAQDDSLVKVEGSLHFAEALRTNNVPFEMHIFESGNHGFALADRSSAGFEFEINPEAAEWSRFAERWLSKRLQISFSPAEKAPFPLMTR